MLPSGSRKSVTVEGRTKAAEQKKTKGSGEDVFSALGIKIKYIHKFGQITVKQIIPFFSERLKTTFQEGKLCVQSLAISFYYPASSWLLQKQVVGKKSLNPQRKKK